jgi:peptidyl-prolyl cis-trans isomerase SurA
MQFGARNTWFVLLLLPCLPLTARAGEVIDRIVATVNGHVILQSELDEALSYEAVLSGRSVTQFTDDERRLVVDRLIDQELLREQMNAGDFRHATQSEVAGRVSDARKQYPEAATDEGWQALLTKFRLNEKNLLAHVEQQINMLRLVNSRLRPTVQIDSKTIEAYYREKFVPQLRQAGANDVPLSEVTTKIRELLTEQKVTELLASWLQTLRSESEVHIPESGPSGEGVQTR